MVICLFKHSFLWREKKKLSLILKIVPSLGASGLDLNTGDVVV